MKHFPPSARRRLCGHRYAAGYADDDDQPRANETLSSSASSRARRPRVRRNARIEVAVPTSVPLSAVTVTLNGTNMTSSFAADPEGNHQLEDVVTGLPLGKSSSSHARPPRQVPAAPGLARAHEPRHPGADVIQARRQVPFVCATPNSSAARFGLPPITRSERAKRRPSTISFASRSTTVGWLDYDPASPPAPPPSSR